jgi:hypothetical protein
MNRSMNQRQRLSLRAIIVTTDHVFSLGSQLYKFPNFYNLLETFQLLFPVFNHFRARDFAKISSDLFSKSWHFIDQSSQKRSNKRAHWTEGGKKQQSIPETKAEAAHFRRRLLSLRLYRRGSAERRDGHVTPPAPIGVRLMSKLIIRASALLSMGSLAARYFYGLVQLKLTGSRLIRIPLGLLNPFRSGQVSQIREGNESSAESVYGTLRTSISSNLPGTWS